MHGSSIAYACLAVLAVRLLVKWYRDPVCVFWQDCGFGADARIALSARVASPLAHCGWVVNSTVIPYRCDQVPESSERSTTERIREGVLPSQECR